MSDAEHISENSQNLVDAVNAAARDANVIREFDRDDLEITLQSLKPDLYRQIKNLAPSYDHFDTLDQNVPLQAALIQADRFLDSVEFKESLNGQREYVWGDGTKDLGEFRNGELIQGTRTFTNGVVDIGLFANGALTRGERRYPDHSYDKGIFQNNALWDGERHAQKNKTSSETTFYHHGEKVEVKPGEVTFGEEKAAAPAPRQTAEAPRVDLADVRKEAQEHPDRYVTGDIKNGMTFTATKGSEAERKVRIEDVVKERDVVLTSTRYGTREFVFDAARGSFYEALPDEQMGDQRLVILNGDVIKEKPPVPVAEEVKSEAPKTDEPAPSVEPSRSTEPMATEPVDAVDAAPHSAPENVAFKPCEYPEMDARSQEWVNAMFRMERTINGIGAMRNADDRDAYARQLQQDVENKYHFGKPVGFDLIKSAIPFARRENGGFSSLAEMEFAIVDAQGGHQLARVKFEGTGAGDSRAVANENAMRAVFSQFHDGGDRGQETRY